MFRMRSPRFPRSFPRAESGVAAIEYALLLALIVLAILPALRLVGPQLAQVYDTIAEKVAEAGAGEPGNGGGSVTNVNDATPGMLDGIINSPTQRDRMISFLGEQVWTSWDEMRDAATGPGSNTPGVGQINALEESGLFGFD